MSKILFSVFAVSTLLLGLGTQASAQGFHGGRHGGGGHHFGGFRPVVSPFMFGMGAPMYIPVPALNCEIQKQLIDTPYGIKKRRVRVCY